MNVLNIVKILLITEIFFLFFIYPEKSFSQDEPVDQAPWKCYLRQVVIEGRSNLKSFNFIYYMPYEDSIPARYGKPICEADTDLVIYKIPVAAFEGDNPLMLSDFRKLVKASEYPVIQVQFDREVFRKIVLKGKPTLNLDLTLAGITNQIPADYVISKRTEHRIILNGETHFYLTDFDLEPPERLFGLVQVENIVIIKFNILLKYQP